MEGEEKMLSMLITLLGGGLGGLLRFVPEIFKLFTEKKDRDHEYRMTQLQLDIDKARAAQAIDLVHAQGDMAMQAGETQAFIEAIKGQSQPTGVKWIDGLNQSVRPVITYWWMSLFTVGKVLLFVAASIELYLALAAVKTLTEISPLLSAFVDKTWTIQDQATLAMIFSFWFVDRSIRKNTGK